MCRMMAARAEKGDDLVDLVLRFREQARASEKGPESEHRHRDGWGLAAFGAGGERVFVRRPADATQDATYEAAARSLSGFEDALVMVHFRNASVGALARKNTHPFQYDGWTFCHNGTVKDAKKIELRGVEYEGDTDSERYFRRLVRQLRSDIPPRAFANTAQNIAANCAFSSLTAFLTNGEDLYAYRALGSDVEDCGTKECQMEYYTLGVARQGRVTLIAQEPTHLGRLTDWKEIPDGAVVEWTRASAPRILPGPLPVQPTSRSR